MSDLLYRLSSLEPSANLSRDAITEILTLQRRIEEQRDKYNEQIEKIQAELREKDLEIEEMKDRLKYEVKMIEGAANDEIHLLNHNIERLINVNKTMREALQKISSHSVQVGFYSEPSENAKIAKEALEKVREA